MDKSDFKGVPVDKDLLKGAQDYTKKRRATQLKMNADTRLIDEYGITGVVKNNIAQEFQNPEFVDKMEKIIKDIKKYGNAETYKIVPKEFAEDIEKYQDALKFIGTKGQERNFDEIFKTRTGSSEFIMVPANYIYCNKCGGYRDKTMYFESADETIDGELHICKDCLQEMCKKFYKEYKDYERTLFMMCSYTNFIFVRDVADKVIKNLKKNKDDVGMLYAYYRAEYNFSIYATTGKGTGIHKNSFEYSNFEGNIYKFVDVPEKIPVCYFEDQNIEKESNKPVTTKSGTITNEMKKKWGTGFKVEEYEKMEELFNELSKFKSKRNIIQTNAIIEYVRLKVKLDEAIGKGDLKDIEKWQKMTDTAAKNAGIKLDQLTAEDFGEGVDSWTGLVEMVEEYNSVVPIMPKMKKMPYDDIDFIIWQVVNYCRRLVELPEVEYEDIWKFIDDRFIEEMKRRGYSSTQIKQEREDRKAIFKELGDNYIEPLWLNPNLQESEEEDLDET